MDTQASTSNKTNEIASNVWKWYTRTEGGGICTTCQTKIMTPTGCTSALHTHAETQHNLFSRKRLNKKGTGEQKDRNNLEMLDRKFPMEAIIARMAACDGLSFRLFRTSQGIRTGIINTLDKMKAKESLPLSDKTIRNLIMAYGENVKSLLKSNLEAKIKRGDAFSISFDEWTSLSNHRYLNVTVLDKSSSFFNLGLVKIEGKADAENLLRLVTERLGHFGIQTRSNVVSFITDGAKVMEKLHRISLVEHQLCLVHGIQLAVTDVLYSSKQRQEQLDAVEEIEGENYKDNPACTLLEDEDDEENGEEGGLHIETIETASDFGNQTFKVVIGKVRRLGAHFKRSAIDNEKLQSLVKKHLQIECAKPLKLDSRTRWSSLYIMLERYWEIKECVDMVLKDIKIPDCKITAAEKHLILCIIKCLKPVMLTVKVLCRRDSDLLKARAALKLLFQQLERNPNPLSLAFVERLRCRIHKRWTLNAAVLQFLQNGSLSDDYDNQTESEDEEEEEDKECAKFFSTIFKDFKDSFDFVPFLLSTSDIFDIPSKTVVKDHIVKLVSRLCSDTVPENVETDLNVNSNAEPLAPKRKKSFEERLNCAVNNIKVPVPPPTPKQSAISKIVNQEMSFLEKNKIRGIYLEKCFNLLLTIKPTSVESERAFSSAGSICTKLRTRCSDTTLDTLAFLRSILNNENSSRL